MRAALLGTMTAIASAQSRPAELPRATPKDAGMSADKLDAVRSLVQAAVDQKKTAGVVVLVARHGKVVQLDAIGMMDIEGRKAMRPDAIFRIYSMTKPITTVGALMLVEE